MNKTTIKITAIKDHGRNHDVYCDRTLWLRRARKAGDTETINNTVLGILRNHPDEVQFEIIARK